ncbi:14545_t:CDS:2 [Entrophospora sp. SA101]|nr:14545_t:CDS:2 [Entrophospora sp. SA101]
MLLWLKKSTATTIKKHEEIEKDFKPFIWTLFHWRKTDNFSTTNYDNLSCINDKIINSTNFSDSIKKKEQINHKPYLLSRLFSLLETFLIREVCLIFLESFTVSIPDRPYILRIMDYIIASFKLASTSPPPQLLLMDQTLDHISLSASAPFVTSSTILLYCYCYSIFLYINMNSIYEQLLLISAGSLWILENISLPITNKLLLLLLNATTNNNNIEKNCKYSFFLNSFQRFLLKSTIIMARIRNWLRRTLFESEPLFNKPWLSSNPKDLWSKRWHQIFNESFKELGYYPIKNLLWDIS